MALPAGGAVTEAAAAAVFLAWWVLETHPHFVLASSESHSRVEVGEQSLCTVGVCKRLQT